MLSTCNRSELYAVVDDAAEGLASMHQFLFDLTGNEEDIEEYLYSMKMRNALTICSG